MSQPLLITGNTGWEPLSGQAWLTVLPDHPIGGQPGPSPNPAHTSCSARAVPRSGHQVPLLLFSGVEQVSSWRGVLLFHSQHHGFVYSWDWP